MIPGITRRVAALAFAAASLLAVPATAGTITFTGTDAVAGPNTGQFFATYTNVNGLNSAKSVADVLAGHVGAAIAAIDGYPGAGDALISVALSFQDMTANDLLTVDMSLQGTFTPGAGATASFLVDDGNSVTNLATISCNSFNVTFHNVPCYPANALQVSIPLSNVDSLTLTWLLQLGASTAPASADFFNSFDVSLTAPAGTIIVNNPGGTLIGPSAPPSSVPEPASSVLFGSGLLCTALVSTALRGRLSRGL
jgi:hypothetical protein